MVRLATTIPADKLIWTQLCGCEKNKSKFQKSETWQMSDLLMVQIWCNWLKTLFNYLADKLKLTADDNTHRVENSFIKCDANIWEIDKSVLCGYGANHLIFGWRATVVGCKFVVKILLIFVVNFNLQMQELFLDSPIDYLKQEMCPFSFWMQNTIFSIPWCKNSFFTLAL